MLVESEIRAISRKTDSGDAKQRYQYGGYSSRILNAAWHGHICVSPLAGFVMAAGFHLKCDVKSPRCLAIKLLSRLASCRRLYLGWRVRGRARSPKWSSDRALDTPAQEINSFIITNNPRALLLLANIGNVRTISSHLSLSLSLSFFSRRE